jgi:hypothetical protein
MSGPDDDLTAFLSMVTSDADQETLTHRPEDCADWRTSCSGHNALRLAAMVRGVLELTGPPDPENPEYDLDGPLGFEVSKEAVREAVTRGLAKEADDGG